MKALGFWGIGIPGSFLGSWTPAMVFERALCLLRDKFLKSIPDFAILLIHFERPSDPSVSFSFFKSRAFYFLTLCFCYRPFNSFDRRFSWESFFISTLRATVWISSPPKACCKLSNLGLFRERTREWACIQISTRTKNFIKIITLCRT